MDLSGLAAVTTAAEMKAWLSANCLSPISPVMTGTDLGIIIQKIIDVTGEVPSFAFENGLTNNNGTVALGGTLTGDVVYNQGNYQTKFNFTDNALNDSFVALGDGYVEIQTNGLTHNNSSARNLGVGTDVSISDGLMDFQVYNLTGSTYSGEFTLGVYGFANQPASSAWELMISNASGQKSFSSSLTVPFNDPSTAVNKGMIFKDSWDNMGLQYYNDYSAIGKTSPRWIPDWGAVTAAISASVGSATPAWSSITGKPTTLSGYGITDAYPLTGNPSGFLTGITSSQVITALGFTPYNASNPSNYIALTALSNSAPITYNSSTGAIGITQATTSTNGYLSSTDWNTFNGKQTALSGTGFVKISGTTISYDNSIYLTTGAAATTYLALTGGTLTGTLTSQSLIPDGNGTRSLGTSSFKWGSVNTNAVTAVDVIGTNSVVIGTDGTGNHNIIFHGGGTGNTGNISISAPGTGTITSYAFNWPSGPASNTTSVLTWGGNGLPMTWTSLSGYLTSATAASTYVPYTGATGNVNLGNNTLFAGTIGVGAASAISPYKFFVSNSGNNGFEVDPTAASGTQTAILSYNRSTSVYTPLTLNASSFAFSSGALFGNTTGTPTATPLIVNLGGTFGTNTPGSYANQKLRLYDDGTGPHSYGLGVSSVGLLEIQAGTSAGIGFFVNGGTQAMNISAGGNVGIGTSNPAFKLDVQGGSASIYNNGAATGLTLGSNATGKTSIAIATSADASGYGYIQSISSSGSTFGNMALNPAGGNIGIGTSSPVYKLVVSNSAANGFEVDPTAVGGTQTALLSYNRSTNTYTPLSFNASSFTFAQGNVLFGNTTSSSIANPLTLSLGGTYGSNAPGNYNNIKLKLWDNGTPSSAYGLGISNNLLELQAGPSAGMGFFVNGGTQAMKIASSGQVNIGTGISPSSQLVINGSNSGSGGGASLVLQTTNVTSFAIGNKSNILGGTYDATPYLFSNAPLYTSNNIIIGGTTSTTHLIGSSATPTITAAAGAGASPTVAIMGSELAHKITVTTGTSPGANSTVVTMGFNSFYATAPYVTISPGNNAAAALSGNQQVSVNAGQFTYVINAGNTGLTASTTYVWHVHVIQ
jgi:hypothetical protein